LPELPEVETIRRELEKEITGKKIKLVEILGTRSVRRHGNPDRLVTQLQGKRITQIRRVGKYLLFDLDGDDILVVHLGMSGQLLRTKGTKEPVAEHTHVIITLSQSGQLRFIDPRTFGEMFIARPAEGPRKVPAELMHLGFDPLANQISWMQFAGMLSQRSTQLKACLTDQEFVAGIGNIYSDEILFAAGLRYDRLCNTLSSQEARRLHRFMIELLNEAVQLRGSSLADDAYKDIYGESGEFQGQHRVYNREGLPCPRCKRKIKRVKASGRSTFFCEHCQL
jgi:formamidopyrimidine-DNA glycosylase